MIFGSVCVICSVNGCVCFKYMNSVFDKSNELSSQSCLKQIQNTECTKQLLRFTSSIWISFLFCYNYKSSKFDLSILFKWQCWFKLKPKQWRAVGVADTSYSFNFQREYLWIDILSQSWTNPMHLLWAYGVTLSQSCLPLVCLWDCKFVSVPKFLSLSLSGYR